MKNQNKLETEFLNKIRPLGPDAAHDRTTPLGWPCGRLLSQPTLQWSLARHCPAGYRRQRAERVHTAPMHMESGERRGRRRPRCTDKTTPSTSTSTRTRRAPTRWRGAHETTGRRKWLRLTSGEVVLRVTMPPLLPVRRGNDRRGVA
jgi:hypothetical protein